MRTQLRYGALLCAFMILACSLCKASDFVEFEEDPLPANAARGFSRSLLAGAITVTVGYQAGAKWKVPTGAADAQPIFDKAGQELCNNGGGVLIIGAGTYSFGGPGNGGQWVLKCGNIKIQGAGIGKTILRLANKAKKWDGIGLISGKNLKGVTLTGFTLDGNKKNQVQDENQSYGRYGIFISPNDNLKINKVAVLNFQKYGIDPPARNVNPATNYSGSKKVTITVTNCIASGNDYDGFIFDTVIGLYAANNTAENNGRYGFNLCTGTWNALVENNLVRNNGNGVDQPGWKSLGGNGCGIMTDTNQLDGQTYVTTNIVYKNNKVIGSKRGGFCGKMAKNVALIGNLVDTASQCMWFSAVDGLKIQNNKCVNTKSLIVLDQKNPNKAVVSSGNKCNEKNCP